ncbi:GPI-linked NAD(P)(+)--arginine ADP-ribosyltransferase 1-like protein [Lates japonicus]|uniref:NAD(P)(+)--arginine ADP-ribosyltransferase n=1 Tax=Lates japonicus TaxID=270547 RepID=A0AAD3MF45_LATJO|nr:GPI-linked NAD(P)(+)--arginine ADP-ribosyltransferase 1-like protein [Lates japonicus]
MTYTDAFTINRSVETDDRTPFKMWDRGKLLLAAVVFTALCYRVAAKHLDMAPHAVDVLYNKCREEAIKEFIHSGVLKAELNGSEGFQEAWSESTRCSEMIPRGIKEHTTALLAYADGNDKFKKTFNDEVETMGANVSSYEKDFHFKSLHFLLMDYMMLPKPENCTTVYVLSEPGEQVTAEKGSKSVETDDRTPFKMWDRGKLLLAAVVFTALCYRVAAKHLDMAPHAVDVLYNKCSKEAIKKFIHSGVLKAELNSSEGFQEAWSESTRCSEMIPRGIKEHTTALLAYADGNDKFKKTFNDEVETMGANVSSYEKDFHFKSLHFLLMDYMMLQKPENCTTVSEELGQVPHLFTVTR